MILVESGAFLLLSRLVLGDEVVELGDVGEGRIGGGMTDRAIPALPQASAMHAYQETRVGIDGIQPVDRPLVSRQLAWLVRESPKFVWLARRTIDLWVRLPVEITEIVVDRTADHR